MMRNQDDQLPESLRAATHDYNDPPALSAEDLDAMWSAVEEDAFPRRFASPSRELPVASRTSSVLSVRNLLPLAAVLRPAVREGRPDHPDDPPDHQGHPDDRSARASPAIPSSARP